MHARTRVSGLGLVAMAALLAGCGSSGGKASAPNTTQAEVTAAPQGSAAPQATTVHPETTPAASAAATDNGSAGTSLPGIVEKSLADHDCPTDESMSAAVGVPVAFDSSDVQAKGFCPYKSADENITVSVTFTPMDMTAYPDSNQTDVPGIGQKALWNEGSDEMVVWFGNGSIIVSVLAFGQGPDFDAKTIATNIAKSVGSM
jgi:hypothetical protein